MTDTQDLRSGVCALTMVKAVVVKLTIYPSGVLGAGRGAAHQKRPGRGRYSCNITWGYVARLGRQGGPNSQTMRLWVRLGQPNFQTIF